MKDMKGMKGLAYGERGTSPGFVFFMLFTVIGIHA